MRTWSSCAYFRQPLWAVKRVRAVLFCISITILSHITKSTSMYSSRNTLIPKPPINDAMRYPDFPEIPGRLESQVPKVTKAVMPKVFSASTVTKS